MRHLDRCHGAPTTDFVKVQLESNAILSFLRDSQGAILVPEKFLFPYQSTPATDRIGALFALANWQNTQRSRALGRELSFPNEASRRVI